MASPSSLPLLHTNPTRFQPPQFHPNFRHKQLYQSPRSIRQSRFLPPFPPSPARRCSGSISTISCAYVSGAPPVSEPEPVDAAAAADGDHAVSSQLISWGLLWSLLLKEKVRIGVSVLTLVGCTTCTLSMPIYSGRFFEVLIGARLEPLWRLLSKVALLYSLEPIFTVIFVVNMNTVWEKVMSTLRGHIFRRILIQKVEFFDRYKVGELSALVTSDLGSLKNIVSENISRDRGFRALSEVIGTICILFSLAPELAPILGILMLSVSVFVAIYKRSTIPVFQAHGKAQAFIADCVTETFSAIRTVRSFGGEKRQMSMFGKQVLAYQSSGIKLGTFKSLNESLTRVAVYVSLLTLYCLGGSKVKTGELAVGIVASFIGFTFTLTFAVQGLVNTFGDLRGAFAAVERINSVLSGVEIDEALAHGLEKDMLEKNKQDDEMIKLFTVNGYSGKNQDTNTSYMSALKSSSNLSNYAWSGDVCLEDVYFSYPLRPDVQVLKGLNLKLKCGTVTALVGPSGSGKSTIVQLLSRFYEPSKGQITIAGEDVRTFEKTEWARVVSIVNQEPVLFSVSVGENIAYGLPDDNVSKDDVIKAAKAANAHEFIISLPQGYDTLVGERGGLLSGGQRQRIAIARALLKDAPILILDELPELPKVANIPLKLSYVLNLLKAHRPTPDADIANKSEFEKSTRGCSPHQHWRATSALDAVSENLVQQALNHLMKGRTTLVIAHRLSTVQNAHQIALCSDGRITELGTHLELLNKKGQYAELVGTQRLAFE